MPSPQPGATQGGNNPLQWTPQSSGLGCSKNLKVTQKLEAETRLIQTRNMAHTSNRLINPWNNTFVKAMRGSPSSEIIQQKQNVFLKGTAGVKRRILPPTTHGSFTVCAGRLD